MSKNTAPSLPTDASGSVDLSAKHPPCPPSTDLGRRAFLESELAQGFGLTDDERAELRRLKRRAR